MKQTDWMRVRSFLLLAMLVLLGRSQFIVRVCSGAGTCCPTPACDTFWGYLSTSLPTCLRPCARIDSHRVRETILKACLSTLVAQDEALEEFTKQAMGRIHDGASRLVVLLVGERDAVLSMQRTCLNKRI